MRLQQIVRSADHWGIDRSPYSLIVEEWFLDLGSS
jgi:hypothetical protein